MISCIIQASFVKIQTNMIEPEKKRQRIYDLINAEIKQKEIPEIIWLFLWPPSSPDPLDYAIWGVLENKTNETSYKNIGSLQIDMALNTSNRTKFLT